MNPYVIAQPKRCFKRQNRMLRLFVAFPKTICLSSRPGTEAVHLSHVSNINSYFKKTREDKLTRTNL